MIWVLEFKIPDFSNSIWGSLFCFGDVCLKLLLVSHGVQLLCFYEVKVLFAIGASENEFLKTFLCSESWIPRLLVTDGVTGKFRSSTLYIFFRDSWFTLGLSEYSPVSS